MARLILIGALFTLSACDDGVDGAADRVSADQGHALDGAVDPDRGTGPVDAQPSDMQSPECDHPIEVQAALIDARTVTRDEAAEIHFSAPNAHAPVHYRFESDVGGIFTEREDRVFWAAGGPDDEDAVDWPWWTGPVRITVHGIDADGCRGQATVTVTLGGDVLLGDALRGTLFAYGSGGRYLGRFTQVTPARGLGALLALPQDAGGEVLAVVGFQAQEGPARIRRIARDGRVLGDFEHTDLAGSPLWEAGNDPRQLIWWADRGEVLADMAKNGRVIRFNPQGEYLGELILPRRDENNPPTIGFAMVGDRPVAANSVTERLYYLDRDPPELMVIAGNGFERVIGLTTGYDGQVVAVLQNGGQEFRLASYDSFAEERASAPLTSETHYVRRFGGGYLSLDLNGFTLRRPDLAPTAPLDQRWDEIAPVNIGQRGGFVWLD